MTARPDTEQSWQELLGDAQGADRRAMEAILVLHERGLTLEHLSSLLGVTVPALEFAIAEASLRRGRPFEG